MTKISEWITRRAAAKLVGVHEYTIQNWQQRGWLDGGVVNRGRGPGRGYRYRPQYVQRVYEQQLARSNEPHGFDDKSELVDSFEARSILGIGKNTLWTWSRKGWLTPVVDGAGYRHSSDKYLLTDVLAIKERRDKEKKARDERGSEVSDDAVLTRTAAAKVIGVFQVTIKKWHESGLVQIARKSKNDKWEYYRVGDLREVKRKLSETDNDEYYTHHQAYYATLTEDLRKIVKDQVASYRGDEPQEIVFADAVACVMAFLHCNSSCCTGLNHQQRVEKLLDFDRVHIPEVTRSHSIYEAEPEADDDYPQPRRSSDDKKEWLQRREESNRLLWLRLSTRYRKWDRDYQERRQSYERLKAC